MDDINPAIMGLLAPGEERHFVFPVYEHMGVYFCLTEMREPDPQTGEADFYRIFESLTENELDWLNENCHPSGGHELVSQMYWRNPIAYDLIQAFLEDQERDPSGAQAQAEVPGFAPGEIDSFINEILGRLT
jgi:hypothetical protein